MKHGAAMVDFVRKRYDITFNGNTHTGVDEKYRLANGREGSDTERESEMWLKEREREERER